MDLPEGNRPYEWVKVQLMGQADNHCEQRYSQFGHRIEFLAGVRWMLDYMDRHELLGVLSETLTDPNPNASLTQNKELK